MPSPLKADRAGAASVRIQATKSTSPCWSIEELDFIEWF